MAVSAKWYGLAFQAAFDAGLDWNAANKIKVMLLSSSYTPDQDTHNYLDDVNTYEISGTGYTAGGAAIGGCSYSYTGGSNLFALTGDDVVWTAATFTARYAVIYYDGGTPALSPLLGYVDFGADQSPAAQNFSIEWHADGILTVTVS